MITIPKYTDPKLQDAVVQYFNDKLASVSAIEYFYPIAHIGTDEEGNTYPLVYTNDGSVKNIMLFPDSKVKSFIFWQFDNSVILEEDDGVQYNLSLIFWGNLDMIENKNYDYTSEIIRDILNVIIAEDVDNVEYSEYYFDDYTKYSEAERQTLMRPNTSFKISFTFNSSYICE